MKLLRQLIPHSWGGFGVLVILVLFPFIIAMLTGQPVDEGAPKFWQGMLIQVFILAVYAMSYDLLMGYTGILSFGHALFFGTGAYVTGLLLKHAEWSLWAALLMVLLVALIQSLLIGMLSLRVSGVYFAMVTLAFAQMFFILSEATDFRQWTGAEDGLQSIPVPAWLSPTDERMRFYFITLGFCVVMYVIARRVVNSPTGRVMAAIRENEQRARMLGYNIFVYKLIAVVLSGLLAALAGSMNALWNLNANPAMLGVNTTINALLMTIIGGAGTLIGPMLGAGVIQLLGYWLNTLFGPRWPLIFGIVYILIVLFFPRGLVGTWRAQRLEWHTTWSQRLRRLGRSV
ncbi:MAG: branched-chain amino acid ABC transporter permease [Chloroflexi bacterium AL-W]|nr:branched-chain amino acid ABC transporter permease [Chloroflexi bacterium AL-N1]NOK67868.1 branched-chain amino acid ABC transporter permease [Chloroflexi bacterium AL-N10]NOK75362.1 branched-chain amino acid ABC transporter permease [Chloroflexi bacterium AL-N5]NOK82150.1 branched-chain amino acid ABC transporter permease [Chloroflexi bacterium AL-W]NOK89995.1 branched-chain amino acid ABC transporter permease [Chloroflexi bacterium AL-N15]